MATRASKRRRTGRKTYEESPEPKSEPQSRAPSPETTASRTPDSSTEWQGWAEVESDPAFFNVMLRDLGVGGVSVREIFSLDAELLASLPRPVYGVIFLYRWKEDEERIDSRHKAGDKVWFANQTVSNACASYALINIVNNIAGIELGPELEQFKEFTQDFTPALRGDALSNFDFVKRIHNSFTRQMDKLNEDLHMRNQVNASKQKGRKRKADDSEEAAHHFIAFMPIEGKLWKMDGLEWQPGSLGRVHSDDWLDQVKADIESRMSKYSDGELDFAILGLVKDPLKSRVAELAINVKTLRQVRARLQDLGRAGSPVEDGDNPLLGADESFGLSPEDVSRAKIMPALLDSIRSGSLSELEAEERDLIGNQSSLRRAVKDLHAAQLDDDAKASKRRHDYGEAIQRWARVLVQKGVVRELLQ